MAPNVSSPPRRPEPIKAYRITQWGESHETAESRKLKYLNWVAAPNKHDGLGFAYLKSQPQQDKKDLYCAFKLMIDLASKATKEERGWLVRSGRPLTAEDMGMMTSFEPEIFAKAMEFFTRPQIRWLEFAEVPEAQLDLPHIPPRSPEHPADSAAPPGDSPGVPASPANGTAASGRKSATDLVGQTGRSDRQGSGKRERADAALAERNQFGALSSQIRELEARRDDLTPQERGRLREKKAALAQLQEKQAAGVGA